MTCLREVGYALHVTDDTGEIIHILGMAMRALLEVTLVDMTAVVTNRVGDIEGEVVTSFDRRYAEELAVLLLAEVFLEVAVECRTTREVLNVLTSVETEAI